MGYKGRIGIWELQDILKIKSSLFWQDTRTESLVGIWEHSVCIMCGVACQQPTGRGGYAHWFVEDSYVE
jgi:hypothetical protein